MAFIEDVDDPFELDKNIIDEYARLVIVRFGTSKEIECSIMDKTLKKAENKISKIARIYLVDLESVNDFTEMYELYDSCTVMFFFRNQHIMVDFGTGNNNKINWPILITDDFTRIVQTIYIGASKGKHFIKSPINYSSKYEF